jgi:hypothetical protein
MEIDSFLLQKSSERRVSNLLDLILEIFGMNPIKKRSDVGEGINRDVRN